MVIPSPSNTAVGYARRAANQAKTAWIDIKIEHMSWADALYWDRMIRPQIVAAARLATVGSPPRADRYWRWPVIRTVLPLTQLPKHRRCRALTILVRDSQGRGIPAGMILLIERYPWLWPQQPTTPRNSVFTWFLAAAPKDSLVRLGVPDPPSLGRILIDSALVTSTWLGSQGQMWLHAAPTGGQALHDFYGKICSLRNLPVGFYLPNRRVSDGRHFFATNSLASQLLTALNGTR